MSKKEKLILKPTFKMSDQDKKNLDEDVVRISESTGLEINKSELIRSFVRDIHKKLEQGLKIVFPIDVKTENEEPDAKKKPRRLVRKKKP